MTRDRPTCSILCDVFQALQHKAAGMVTYHCHQSERGEGDPQPGPAGAADAAPRGHACGVSQRCRPLARGGGGGMRRERSDGQVASTLRPRERPKRRQAREATTKGSWDAA